MASEVMLEGGVLISRGHNNGIGWDVLASFLRWRPRPNVSELGPNIPSLPGPRSIENAGAKAGTHGEVQETGKPLICHDEFAI
jgi:hypothetical protein